MAVRHGHQPRSLTQTAFGDAAIKAPTFVNQVLVDRLVRSFDGSPVPASAQEPGNARQRPKQGVPRKDLHDWSIAAAGLWLSLDADEGWRAVNRLEIRPAAGSAGLEMFPAAAPR